MGELIFIVIIVVLLCAKYIFREQNKEYLQSIEWLERLRNKFNPRDSESMDCNCSSKRFRNIKHITFKER